MIRHLASFAAAFTLTVFACARPTFAQDPAAHNPTFRVLAITSKAKDHLKMIAAAAPMLEKMAAENRFAIDISDDATLVNDENLAGYQVFVQLQQAPFDFSPTQQQALQKFIEAGHGWVGIHAAGLTGKSFTNKPYWQWFEDFLGGVTYSPHPKFQPGTLMVEDRTHPASKNLPARIDISDEWYEFNESPRPRVRVLATADESTYKQNKPMGDHPLVWTNEKYPRTIYIAIGHDAALCDNPAFQTLVRDAILWAGSSD